MMGLPEGWVCDVGLSRTAALHLLGNGVVPAQAALALTLLDPLNHDQEA
jgi:DNA (cytosine-5)-methyltransferase 1